MKQRSARKMDSRSANEEFLLLHA